jgi:hypothetical protein
MTKTALVYSDNAFKSLKSTLKSQIASNNQHQLVNPESDLRIDVNAGAKDKYNGISSKASTLAVHFHQQHLYRPVNQPSIDRVTVKPARNPGTILVFSKVAHDKLVTLDKHSNLQPPAMRSS